MKFWQKCWLYFLIIFSLLHLLRDILQDLHIKVFLSTILVKTSSPNFFTPIWVSWNTYIIEVVEIILAIFLLAKRTFGVVGWLTICIAIATVVGFLLYWFVA